MNKLYSIIVKSFFKTGDEIRYNEYYDATSLDELTIKTIDAIAKNNENLQTLRFCESIILDCTKPSIITISNFLDPGPIRIKIKKLMALK